ncbi:MAG: hypothetical protein IH577_04540 [Deltaproteobacteria bacterium]|nr:hypothetical protein [Deltaproteobacteria bacterium]
MKGIVIAAIAALLLGCSSGSNETPKAAKTPEQIMIEKQNFETCKAKLATLREMGLLYNLEARDDSPLVVVGDDFYKIPFDLKRGFAYTVNCFLVAGEDKYVDFQIRDSKTNKVVAFYYRGVLDLK